MAQASTDQIASLYQQAGEAYSQGNFNQSVQIYQQLLSQNGSSVGLCYNLANSYAQLGQQGKAVLFYLRALVLDPSNAEIAANLQLLNKQAGLFPTEDQGIGRMLSFLTIDQWTYLQLLTLALLAILATCRYRGLMTTRLFAAATCVSLICTICAMTAISFQYKKWQGAIVIAPESRLLISPFSGAQAVSELPEGRRVFIDKPHADYFLVTDETGRKGWIPKNAVEKILP